MPSEASLRLLDGALVETLLHPDAVLAAVRDAFILHSQGEGRVFPVVREPLERGIFGIKAGTVPAQGLLGFKAAGFWPGNRGAGGEPHQATILLIDPATGRPLCLIDGNAVTTMRTGAAGALGLLQLARPDSTRLCLFGTGVQARVQLRFALDRMPALRRVRYVTARGEPSPAFEAAFAARCAMSHARDPDAAVADSDVVITATPGGGALFDAGAVRPGTHLTCVGTDTKGKRELPAGLLERTCLFVDDREQSRRIGEGQWAPDHPAVELGDLLTGRAQAGRSGSDITVFDMTGLALQDLTVARMLFDRAVLSDLGTRVPWPW
ncbi:ornithine cyclodeaminase family protein [Methylobacterium planeticum]|uniref:Ornithine cyclodeaminase family protein n=1 Tax=Methylobacterium planeticum TaxID=2615211 RepID=A0A6N6MHA0_9HYPH|nr:ornithine cyclodeaminase family protein [Methylobacterium planeticum]KAB1070320.1 ornithine cyclodeaminase family protein [Methylobacterium planeticum]